jgi:pimeloyl-ACP methyl ester carboxylesterase
MMTPAVSFLDGPGGGRVAYAVHGAGPLVICPAWWVSHVERDWTLPSFRTFFQAMGEKLTVVRYDRPGVGLSDASRVAWSLDHEVAVLANVVEHLREERVSLLGISCGAPPSVALAASRPDRIARLCLYGAYADGNDIAPIKVRSAMLEMVRAHWGLGSRTLADIFVPDLSGPDLETLGRWQRETTDGSTAAKLLEMTYEMNVVPQLASVRAPTMVVHRKGDRAIPFRAGRALAAGIPGAKLVPLEGRAHLPWEGDGDVARLVATFFAEGTLSRSESAASSAGCYVDGDNCELVVDGQRQSLTPLELGVLRYFEEHPKRVVKRPDLLANAWGQQHVGSNVIEGVVRALRKKLGVYRSSIETVTGHGYRFRGWIRGEP